MHDTVMDSPGATPITRTPTSLPASPADTGPIVRALPTVEAPSTPPPRSRLITEFATVAQPLRLLGRANGLRRAPRGDGRVVVDIPGWLTGSETMAPLRWYLRTLGHDAVPWGLGRNGTDVEGTIERFEPVLERLVAEGDGRPAFLVGWSLGGVIARETARNRPDLVERLATFGTPAQGGPSFTAGASRIGAEECARIAAIQDEANRFDPIQQRSVAIYTKADAVVDWKACVDPYALDIEHVEVGSTHFGLGVDPDVWRTVAHAFAAD